MQTSSIPEEEESLGTSLPPSPKPQAAAGAKNAETNMSDQSIVAKRRKSSRAIFVEIPPATAASGGFNHNPPFSVARRFSTPSERIQEHLAATSPARSPTGYVARAISMRGPVSPEARQTRFWRFIQTLIDADAYRYNPDIIPPAVQLSGAAPTSNSVSPFTTKPLDVESGSKTVSGGETAGIGYAGGCCSCLPPGLAKILSWITYGNLLVCILTSVLVVEIYSNRGFSPLNVNPLFGVSIETMASLGGTVTSWVRIKPEEHWWRLFTSSFLHSGIIHLLVNASALLVLCPKLYAWFGPVRLTMIYFISMLGGQVTTTALHIQNFVVVGASGAICGLIGAILADNIVNWRVLNHPRFQMGYWSVQLALFLVVGLIPFVDNLAHVGGVITGFGAGLILARRVGGYQYHKFYISYILFPALGLVLCFVIYLGGLFIIVRNLQLQSKGLCYAFLSSSC
ncbi:hypothetical protein HDU67_003433 [Dinochytrium kinnereticum]|nr:hypothetical protein HDU67_003433 [Dinochytrium kinnereticum]